MAPSSGFLDFAISMRPDYHQAIIDTIRHYRWDKIIYLYDSHDGKCVIAYAIVFLLAFVRIFCISCIRCELGRRASAVVLLTA